MNRVILWFYDIVGTWIICISCYISVCVHYMYWEHRINRVIHVFVYDNDEEGWYVIRQCMREFADGSLHLLHIDDCTQLAVRMHSQYSFRLVLDQDGQWTGSMVLHCQIPVSSVLQNMPQRSQFLQQIESIASKATCANMCPNCGTRSCEEPNQDAVWERADSWYRNDTRWHDIGQRLNKLQWYECEAVSHWQMLCIWIIFIRKIQLVASTDWRLGACSLENIGRGLCRFVIDISKSTMLIVQMEFTKLLRLCWSPIYHWSNSELHIP